MDIDVSKVDWSIVVAFSAFIVSVIGLSITYANRRDQKLATWLKLYDLIKYHHSSEITTLRGKRFEIERVDDFTDSEDLRQLKRSASELANYYEGVGMFLEGVWKQLDKKQREAMMQLLHNSTTQAYPILKRHAEKINPRGAADWAGSFRWLDAECRAYRVKMGHTNE